MPIVRNYKLDCVRTAIKNNNFVKYDENGTRYVITSLNKRGEVNQFNEEHKHNGIIPWNFNRATYKRVRNDFVLAILSPKGKWNHHASAGSFKKKDGPKKSKSLVGPTSTMKNMKMSLVDR